MRTQEAKRNVEIKKRVRKAHAVSKLAGVLYFLGAVALAALVCMPIVNITGEKLWIVDFWKPFKDMFKVETRNWFAVIIAGLYALTVLTAVINVLRCFGKLAWLSKRSLRYVNGYNKNAYAMQDLGKLFSGTLAMIVNCFFLIYLLFPYVKGDGKVVEFTMYTYILLGVGLFVHFVAGMIEGKVSHFAMDEVSGKVEEEKRECSTFLYFFRNVLQLAAIGGIMFYFVQHSDLYFIVKSLLAKQNPFKGMDMVKEILPLALYGVSILFMFVLVKHATASTEFNRLGSRGKGMHNFRVFSFFTFLALGGVFAIQFFVIKPETKNYDFAIMAAIAFVAFLLDCAFQSRNKADEVEEEIEEEAEEPQQPIVYPQYPVQPVQQNPNGPIYLPIYYPVYMEKPAPAPAPASLMPTPSPAAIERERTEEVELDPYKKWRIRCPKCGKELIVGETSPYHRCPACDKVFAMKKFRTYKKK